MSGKLDASERLQINNGIKQNHGQFLRGFDGTVYQLQLLRMDRAQNNVSDKFNVSKRLYKPVCVNDGTKLKEPP